MFLTPIARVEPLSACKVVLLYFAAVLASFAVDGACRVCRHGQHVIECQHSAPYIHGIERTPEGSHQFGIFAALYLCMGDDLQGAYDGIISHRATLYDDMLA